MENAPRRVHAKFGRMFFEGLYHGPRAERQDSFSQETDAHGARQSSRKFSWITASLRSC